MLYTTPSGLGLIDYQGPGWRYALTPLRKFGGSRESKPLSSGLGYRPALFVEARSRFCERYGGKMGRAGRPRMLGGCRCHGFCWMLREIDRYVFPGKNPASGAGVGVDGTRGDARFAHLPRAVILPRFQRSIRCLRPIGIARNYQSVSQKSISSGLLSPSRLLLWASGIATDF